MVRRFQYSDNSGITRTDFVILNDSTSDEEAFDKYGRNQNKWSCIFYGFFDWEKFDINKIKKEET